MGIAEQALVGAPEFRYGDAMTRLLSTHILAAVLALGACLPGCSTIPVPAQSEAAASALLARQAHAWDAAIVGKDMAAVAANMAPDFRHIRQGGQVSDGAAFLAFIGSPKLVIHPYHVDDLDVRL